MTTKNCSETFERGATMVEYAILLMLVSGICAAVLTLLARNMSDNLTTVGNTVGGN